MVGEARAKVEGRVEPGHEAESERQVLSLPKVNVAGDATFGRRLL
jgi:hypothetical protein